MIHDLVDVYVVDGRVWYGGETLTPNQQHLVRGAAIVVVGTLSASLFQILFMVVDKMSMLVVPGYRDQKRMTRVDWTSRWVAMLFILINSVGLAMIASYDVHDLDPVHDAAGAGHWETSQWVYDKAIPHSFYHVMFWHYILLFAYELYDLKNCVEIKMYSGVLHHIVLLIIFPLVWVCFSLFHFIFSVLLLFSFFIIHIHIHIHIIIFALLLLLFTVIFFIVARLVHVHSRGVDVHDDVLEQHPRASSRVHEYHGLPHVALV